MYRQLRLLLVMPALVAGIHVFLISIAASKTWMAGTSPAMTMWRVIAQKQIPLPGGHSSSARDSLRSTMRASNAAP